MTYYSVHLETHNVTWSSWSDEIFNNKAFLHWRCQGREQVWWRWLWKWLLQYKHPSIKCLIIIGPNFMGIDGTYDQNIQTPLTFSYCKVLNNISIKSNYIQCGEAMKDSGLNRFKSTLDACAVAGGFNRQLISHLAFHSNEYVWVHLGDKNWFCCYKWINMKIDELYCLLSQNYSKNNAHFIWYKWILFNIVSSNIYITLSNVSIWNQILSFVDKKCHLPDSHAAFHQESGVRNKGDKCHQLRTIAHFNMAAARTFIPVKDVSFLWRG